MKKAWILPGLIIAVLFTFVYYISSEYKELSLLDEKISENWSETEIMFERKIDSTSNLVKSIRDFSDEDDIALNESIKVMRSFAECITVSATKDKVKFEKLETEEKNLDTTINKMLVLSDSYSDKSDNEYKKIREGFEEIDATLTSRKEEYNKNANKLNTKLKEPLNKLTASIFSLKSRQVFEIPQKPSE